LRDAEKIDEKKERARAVWKSGHKVEEEKGEME
jgi:hypothetical protein